MYSCWHRHASDSRQQTVNSRQPKALNRQQTGDSRQRTADRRTFDSGIGIDVIAKVVGLHLLLRLFLVALCAISPVQASRRY
jgi:hypothetical protein